MLNGVATRQRHGFGQHRDAVVVRPGAGASRLRRISASACSSSSRAVGMASTRARRDRAGASRSRARGRTSSAAAPPRRRPRRADDLGQALEAAEERRRIALQVHEHRGRPSCAGRSSIQIGVSAASGLSIRQCGRNDSGGCATAGGRALRWPRIGGEHAHAAVRGLGLGDDARGHGEPIVDMRVEIDRRHCSVAAGSGLPAFSCASSQVVSSGTGRPVAPFSLPSATRCRRCRDAPSRISSRSATGSTRR